MSTTQKVIWAVVIIVILGGLYWWWSSSQSTAAPIDLQTNLPAATTTSDTSTSAPMSATVTFDGSGFSPASVTIAQGGTVTWVSTAGSMWVASDPYPLQNGYDGTTMEQHCAPDYTGAAPFDECAGGTDYSFTFNAVGTWGYHDYSDPSATGEVSVVAQ